MELITYKTNISSEVVLEKLRPLLNQTIGSGNWGTDLNNKDKIVRVYAPGTLDENAILKAFGQAGISAVNLDDYYSIY